MYSDKRKHFGKGLFFLFFALCLATAGILDFFRNSAGNLGEEGAAAISEAIRRSALQCYAVEGQYPPSISYLVEHYGLIYDTDAFLIDYDSFGDNLYPEYTIVTRTGNHIFDY